jgi:colanic acid/amylovoran biosynthesis glycosyltransferase
VYHACWLVGDLAKQLWNLDGQLKRFRSGVDTIKIAYLTNLYPAVSHSFIRREILAIEELGFPITRWSIRPAPVDLKDPEDIAELAKTSVVLRRPIAVCIAAVASIIASPRLATRAVKAALEGRKHGIGPLVARFAHFAEGCFLARELQLAGVDHLHVHFGTNPTAVARVCHIMGGPRYSFTAHGPDEFDQPEAINLGKKVAESAFAVAISSFGKSQLMRWTSFEHWSRINTVRCGVDQAFLSTFDSSNEGLSSKRLSCVARLAPQKGLSLLIEAAGLLKAKGVDFEIVIVGEGPLRGDLEALIDQLELCQNIKLVGWASSETVRDTILSSRAMVLPSFAEGLPVVIMESLALARPVIATAIAGIPELVDESCGWLVPSGSVEDLADAMNAALESSETELAALGREGERRVNVHHDASLNAKRLLDHILEAADDRFQ